MHFLLKLKNKIIQFFKPTAEILKIDSTEAFLKYFSNCKTNPTKLEKLLNATPQPIFDHFKDSILFDPHILNSQKSISLLLNKGANLYAKNEDSSQCSLWAHAVKKGRFKLASTFLAPKISISLDNPHDLEALEILANMDPAGLNKTLQYIDFSKQEYTPSVKKFLTSLLYGSAYFYALNHRYIPSNGNLDTNFNQKYNFYTPPLVDNAFLNNEAVKAKAGMIIGALLTVSGVIASIITMAAFPISVIPFVGLALSLGIPSATLIGGAIFDISQTRSRDSISKKNLYQCLSRLPEPCLTQCVKDPQIGEELTKHLYKAPATIAKNFTSTNKDNIIPLSPNRASVSSPNEVTNPEPKHSDEHQKAFSSGKKTSLEEVDYAINNLCNNAIGEYNYLYKSAASYKKFKQETYITLRLLAIFFDKSTADLVTNETFQAIVIESLAPLNCTIIQPPPPASLIERIVKNPKSYSILGITDPKQTLKSIEGKFSQKEMHIMKGYAI